MSITKLVESITSIRGDLMPKACRVGDSMQGSVGHHAGHIIGWTGGEHPQPIYCSGHSVTGKQTTGQSKVLIQGKPVATVGNTGTSTYPCDGQGYTNSSGSSKVFIQGRPAVRIGDKVNIHGQGTGTMTTGSDKVFFA
jgi:uncharacterized Zn-binding protein involved in type VI secretion